MDNGDGVEGGEVYRDRTKPVLVSSSDLCFELNSILVSSLLILPYTVYCLLSTYHINYYPNEIVNKYL